MPAPEDEEPDWAEIAAIMREAIAKDRGYASYWEWPPNRSTAEIGVAKALAEHLAHAEGRTWASVRPVKDDPPDTLLLSNSGQRVGVEVTEIVDSATVARHRFRKKNGAAEPYDWAEWTLENLTKSIVQAIERKDRKLAPRAGQYDELIVALITDEPMITFDLARHALLECSPKVQTIHSAFLMLSYDPGADKKAFPQGVPIMAVPLLRTT